MLFGSEPFDPALLDQKWEAKLPAHGKNFSVTLRPDHEPVAIQPKYTLLARRNLWVTAEVALSSTGNNAIIGNGSRFLGSSALRIAFAEAWERFIAQHVVRASLNHKEFFYRFYSLRFDKLGGLRTVRPCVLAPCNSSNGFAAGPTLVVAAQKAVAELFERHCVLSVWNMDYDPVRLHIGNPAWLAPAISNGWRIHYFNLGASKDLVTVGCLALHEKLGARFDACADTSVKTALKASSTTVLRMIYHLHEEASNFDSMWADGQPMSHYIYYADPARLNAFDFLLQAKNKTPYEHSNFEAEVIPIWVAGKLPAVARAQWKEAKELCWGKDSYALCPRNHYPHPLA